MPEQAQLGAMPYINLGGYIPAPAQNSLKREVLGAMLSKVLTEGIDVAGSKLGPDYAKMLEKSGVPDVPKAAWYQKNMDAQTYAGLLRAYQEGRLADAQVATANAVRDPTVNRINAETGATKAATDTENATRDPKVRGLNANAALSEANVSKTLAEVADMLEMGPIKKDYMKAQTANLGANTAQTTAMTPAQVKALEAQTALTDTQQVRASQMWPAELANLEAQTALSGTQRAGMEEQTNTQKTLRWLQSTQQGNVVGPMLDARMAQMVGLDLNTTKGKQLAARLSEAAATAVPMDINMGPTTYLVKYKDAYMQAARELGLIK